MLTLTFEVVRIVSLGLTPVRLRSLWYVVTGTWAERIADVASNPINEKVILACGHSFDGVRKVVAASSTILY